MKIDRVAAHNRRMWERLARAGIPYTRPQGRPPRTRAGMRRFLDPPGWLRGVRLAGARVLVLAGGGGWDAVLFAKLGAETTLLDISRRQLDAVRELARKERVRARIVQGNMKDLSRFADASFDVVWHGHSLVFVDDAAGVLREVGRVLAPGGTYVLSTVHPKTMRLYGTFAGGGWRPSISYAHRFETIINGIAAGGMLVDGLWELRPQELEPPRRRPRNPPPGSDDHLRTLFPAYVQVRARRPRGALTR